MKEGLSNQESINQSPSFFYCFYEIYSFDQVKLLKNIAKCHLLITNFHQIVSRDYVRYPEPHTL